MLNQVQSAAKNSISSQPKPPKVTQRTSEPSRKASASKANSMRLLIMLFSHDNKR